MLHFYKSPKGDYVNFRQMVKLVVSHEKSWVVDEAGDRFAIGHADDIPCFINFLNDATLEENQIVSHEDFAIYRQAAKRATGEPTTHEELDHPPGVGIPPTYGGPPMKEGDVPPSAPPPPEGSIDSSAHAVAKANADADVKKESDMMYPPEEDDGSKDIAGDQPPSKKKGGKKK